MKEKEKERIERRKMAVLKRIVERRRELGISQWDLGIAINLTNSGYFKVETGKTRLDILRLFEILEKLDISLEEFFKGIK
jgi:transcriptional regulator with XRE-family HTH domain